MIKLLNLLNEWKLISPPLFKPGKITNEDGEPIIITGPPVRGYKEAEKRVAIANHNLQGDTEDRDGIVFLFYDDDDEYYDDDDLKEKELEYEGYFYPVEFQVYADGSLWNKNSYFSEAYILKNYSPKKRLHQTE